MPEAPKHPWSKMHPRHGTAILFPFLVQYTYQALEPTKWLLAR
jgi:hypothetical protein